MVDSNSQENATCKGSVLLGNNCGHCSRCKAEAQKFREWGDERQRVEDLIPTFLLELQALSARYGIYFTGDLHFSHGKLCRVECANTTGAFYTVTEDDGCSQ